MNYRKHLWHKVFLALFVLSITLIVAQQACLALSIQVAPHRFVYRIDEKNNTQMAVITNISKEPIRVKIYTQMSENQQPEHYMGDWVIIYPRIVNLNPGEKKTIRFSTRVPAELRDGEYRTLLFFEEIPNNEQKKKESEEIVLDINLSTKLGINLYGQYGRIIHKGIFEELNLNIKDSYLQIKGNFINQGNAHLMMKVNIIVLDSTGQIVKEDQIPVFAIHRGQEDIFDHQINFSGSGKYTLKIILKQEDVIVCEYTKEFEVHNPDE